MIATELTIQLPHLRLAAKAWGNPAQAPVLALHGWLDNAASFDELAPLLENCYVVAIDLPGHGLSDHRPAGTWYHYVDYLDEAMAAANALGWQRFSLLGHSLGGAIASVLAAIFPERTERLLLIEALGPLSLDPEQTLVQLHSAITRRAQANDKSLRVFTDIEEAITARAKASDLSIDAAAKLVSRGLKAVRGGYSWASDPRLTLPSPIRYTEAQINALMHGIKAPGLLILAEPGAPFVDPVLMRARIAAVPDLTSIRLAGNHHLHLEDAQPVAAAINDFMRQNRVS